MKKKILIGSMLVLTLLLLMPSIPAIQHKTIEEGIKQDLQELEWIRHPLLYTLVMLLCYFRMIRATIILNIASDYIWWYHDIHFPLLFIRGVWLAVTSGIWYTFWQIVSDILGWGWDTNPFMINN